MEIEKEIRYRIDNNTLNKIKEVSKLITENQKQTDIVFGYDGFKTLQKNNFICRVREKNNLTLMQIKRMRPDKSFEEYTINIDNANNGINFFRAMGMEPYLYIKKNREIMEYRGLKIFIDRVEMIGNFVEIEFQDCPNHKRIIEEFLVKVGIKGNPKPLYGDIFKKKILEDMKFKEDFNNNLKQLIEG